MTLKTEVEKFKLNERYYKKIIFNIIQIVENYSCFKP